MVDINWLQTQEGQKAYQTWIRKLANRAEDRTDIPILVDTNGEIQVWVTINKKYLSKEQFEKLADKSDGEITTKLEFKTKDIIIRELTSIAKAEMLQQIMKMKENFYVHLFHYFREQKMLLLMIFAIKLKMLNSFL